MTTKATRRTKPTRPCARCSKPFVRSNPADGGQLWYCSQKCADLARADAKREWWWRKRATTGKQRAASNGQRARTTGKVTRQRAKATGKAVATGGSQRVRPQATAKVATVKGG